jgi:hypothetical protein
VRSAAWLISAALAILLSAIALSGCAAPGPTPRPNAVVHFRNLTSSALFLPIQSGDFEIQGFVRPCGGEAAYAVPDPTGDDPRVTLGALYDRSGYFDGLVLQVPTGTDRLRDMKGHVSFSGIIWSRGDIGVEDMPIWVTLRPEISDVSDTAFTATAPPQCDPIPASE